ncbi:MAG: hypothetical protein J6Y71_00990 [Ruminococcus sp.]|nr:hypothetical protein [Ruminococcus sp.]
MTILKKIAAAVLAAGLFSTTGVSCSLKNNDIIEATETNESRSTSSSVSSVKTDSIDETLEFEDIDFAKGECHGVSFGSSLKGTVIVSCDDVEEPEIRVRVDFKGGSKKRRKLERENLEIRKSLNEDGILSISFIDKTTDYPAKSSYNPMKQEFEGVLFSHAITYVEMNLPRKFNSFTISNYGGDIGAKDLSGHINLFSYNTITGENIAFDASDDNIVDGEEGVFISTGRLNSIRSNALIMTRKGEIRYVMPNPDDMTGRYKPDTIRMLGSSEGSVTVDLNGNKCADTSWFDKENQQYNYSVAQGAAMLDIESFGTGVNFTNGTYNPSVD